MDGVERTSAYHIIKFNHIFTPFCVDVYFLLEKKSQRLISLYCNLVKVDLDIRTCKMLISKLNGVIAYIYQYVHSESLIMNKSSGSQFDRFYRISIILISLIVYDSLYCENILGPHGIHNDMRT